jgi:hypothetical protein
MPLISKIGPSGEKCASCNQILNTNQSHNHNHIHNNNIIGNHNNNHYQGTGVYPSQGTSSNVNTDFTMSPSQNRFQMKNIQDYSNRLGFGSYSRLLNAMSTEENEKFSIGNLPEINRNAPSSNYNNRRNVNITQDNPIKFSNLIFSDGDRKKNKDDFVRKNDKEKYPESSNGNSNINSEGPKNSQK